MEFVLATTFLILYYVRPHEWLQALASWQLIARVLLLGLVVVFYRTGRRVQWHPARFAAEFLSTPTDWALAAFTAWTLYAAADGKATWSAFYPLLAYYTVVYHALSTPKRIERFLWVWIGLIMFIATMAVLSHFDIDPFGSNQFTQGMYKGRLSLNLSIFNNPNALAHSVLLILPMIYFLAIWRRMLLVKELSLLLFVVPFWCLFLTQSKGAYLSGAAGVLATQVIGRPKWVQASVVLAVYIIGTSALLLLPLPRMHELESVRGDAGFKGRLLAWNFAWESFQTLPKGLGLGQFQEHVPVYTEGKISVRKSTHNSYAEVAAELGRNGLILWLALIYYCFRSLLLLPGTTDQEERIRRTLFCLMVIYMASSWVTNISYRGSLMIQIGVVAAYCRHMRRNKASQLGAGTAETPDGPGQIQTLPQAPVFGALPTPGGEGVFAVTTAPSPGPPLADSGPVLLPPDRLHATSSATGAVGLPDEPSSGIPARDIVDLLREWFAARRLVLLLLDGLLIYVSYRVVIRAWLYFMNEWTGL